MMLVEILEDVFFAALAAIGFAIISNPPRQSLLVSALLAAIGHGIRFFLMHSSFFLWNICPASFIASLSVGFLSILFARYIRVPAEVFAFPSLLPMIPGMYAYRIVQSLLEFMRCSDESRAIHYIYLFFFNGMTTLLVLIGLVLGAALPIFIFKKVSFSVTRH